MQMIFHSRDVIVYICALLAKNAAFSHGVSLADFSPVEPKTVFSSLIVFNKLQNYSQ